jgi:pimeloyl-ACP methyl ester carboxylesterase
MSDGPTVVLVHGAWHNDTCWNLVRGLLDERGIPSVTVQLPQSTLDQDAAVVRTAIDEAPGDVIVVGHSWGGSPVTMGAAGSDKVRHLVYLAAFMVEIGLPVTEFETRHETTGAAAMVPEGDYMVIDPDLAVAAFYHDVEPGLAAETAAELRPFELRGFQPVQTDLVAAWKTVPSTYVLTTDDRSVHPEDQRIMARNATEVVEIPTGHSPFLSRPDLVADIVAERWERVRDARGAAGRS